MVPPDHDAVRLNLRLKVPVANLPGKLRKVLGISPAYFRKGFRQGQNLDHPAILKHQAIAMPQRVRVDKVEQKLQPAITHHRHAAAVPRRVVKGDGITCCVSRWLNPCCAYHRQNRK